jgi:hypothetical protein
LKEQRLKTRQEITLMCFGQKQVSINLNQHPHLYFSRTMNLLPNSQNLKVTTATGILRQYHPRILQLRASIFLFDNFQVVNLNDSSRASPPASDFQVVVLPNPASNFASVQFTLKKPAKIKLKFMMGLED